MTAAHTFFSLYFSTGKPAPIRNAEGPLVTLPFHPRWLRHSLTMIHFCPHPAPGGLGWSRQSPGGAEMRRIEHRNHRHRSRVERAFSQRRSISVSRQTFSAPPPTPLLVLEFRAGSTYAAVSFQKDLLGHLWSTFSDTAEMYCWICTSPHLTDRSGSCDLRNNSPSCHLPSVPTFVQDTWTFTGSQGICSQLIEPSPLARTRNTNRLLKQWQIIPAFLWGFL